jgi:hypothetical protein
VDQEPFQASFEGCIENFFSGATYASTVYWYLNEGGTDPYVNAYTVSDRLAYFMPVLIAGRIEGEAMTVASVTRGAANGQDMSNFSGGIWSNNSQMWWTGG